MDSRLAGLLQDRGIDSDFEFSCLYPHASRKDGWSALDVYEDEVRERRRLFDELQGLGMLPGHEEDFMLDFGSGLASNCIALARRIRLAVALDGSFDHCVSATECIRAEDLGNVAVFHGSLLPSSRYATIPFHASSFNMIVVHHGCGRQEIPLLMGDWAGLLNPGGYIYIVYPRFWFEDSCLNGDEAELRSAMEELACNALKVDLTLLQTLARLARLREVYHGSLESLPPVDSTGIVYLSTGIVSSREEFSSLVGDFDRRWRVRQRVLVLQAV